MPTGLPEVAYPAEVFRLSDLGRWGLLSGAYSARSVIGKICQLADCVVKDRPVISSVDFNHQHGAMYRKLAFTRTLHPDYWEQKALCTKKAALALIGPSFWELGLLGWTLLLWLQYPSQRVAEKLGFTLEAHKKTAKRCSRPSLWQPDIWLAEEWSGRGNLMHLFHHWGSSLQEMTGGQELSRLTEFLPFYNHQALDFALEIYQDFRNVGNLFSGVTFSFLGAGARNQRCMILTDVIFQISTSWCIWSKFRICWMIIIRISFLFELKQAAKSAYVEIERRID